MHELFPKLFSVNETIVELVIPIGIMQLSTKAESFSQQRKYKNGYYMNADKAVWGDSFINFSVVSGIQQEVTSLLIIIQSKRHRVPSSKDNISDENYIERLTRASSVKENEIILYIYLSDSDTVTENIKWNNINFVIFAKNKHHEYYGPLRTKLRSFRNFKNSYII
jgi:hypothetical protein